jgi:hypothetical protein
MNPKKDKKARRQRLLRRAANIAKFTPKEKIHYCPECKQEKHARSEKEMQRINEEYDIALSVAKRLKNEAIEKLNKENILTIESEVMHGKSRCIKHYKPTN